MIIHIRSTTNSWSIIDFSLWMESPLSNLQTKPTWQETYIFIFRWQQSKPTFTENFISFPIPATSFWHWRGQKTSIHRLFIRWVAKIEFDVKFFEPECLGKCLEPLTNYTTVKIFLFNYVSISVYLGHVFLCEDVSSVWLYLDYWSKQTMSYNQLA